MRTTQYISVKVDIEDFDDDVILEVAKKRNLTGYSDASDEITEMFYAFKLGRNDRAMEIARKIASDQTGMIL